MDNIGGFRQPKGKGRTPSANSFCFEERQGASVARRKDLTVKEEDSWRFGAKRWMTG